MSDKEYIFSRESDLDAILDDVEKIEYLIKCIKDRALFIKRKLAEVEE